MADYSIKMTEHGAILHSLITSYAPIGEIPPPPSGPLPDSCWVPFIDESAATGSSKNSLHKKQSTAAAFPTIAMALSDHKKKVEKVLLSGEGEKVLPGETQYQSLVDDATQSGEKEDEPSGGKAPGSTGKKRKLS